MDRKRKRFLCVNDGPVPDNVDQDVPRWCYLIPFDTCNKPVLVDRRLLDSFECRMAALLRHQKHDVEVRGTPAWYVSTSRSVLVAFVQALVHHEFVVPRDVQYCEVIRFLEYEGVSTGRIVGHTSPTQVVSLPAYTLGSQRDFDTRALEDVVEKIACALLEWPRLYFGLRLAADGLNPGFAASASRVWLRFAKKPDVPSLHAGAGFENLQNDTILGAAWSPTNWLLKALVAIGFAHYDLVEAANETWVADRQVAHEAWMHYISGVDSIASDWRKTLPSLFVSKLNCVKRRAVLPGSALQRIFDKGCLVPIRGDPDGYAFVRTSEANSFENTSRSLLMYRFSASKEAFDVLAERGIHQNRLGGFIHVRSDTGSKLAAKVAPKDTRMADAHRHATRFCKFVLARVSEGGAWPKDEPQLVDWTEENLVHDAKGRVYEDIVYARSCVQLAEQLVRETPNCSRLFGNVCACVPGTDRNKDSTPERNVFNKTLKKHRIKVLQWADEVGADIADPLVFPPNFHGGKIQSSTPCVLLQFD